MGKRVPVEDREYYTTSEVAGLVGISTSTLAEGVRDGDAGVAVLGALKVRRTIRWPKARVDRWLAAEGGAA